jgi:hypothetical protein
MKKNNIGNLEQPPFLLGHIRFFIPSITFTYFCIFSNFSYSLDIIKTEQYKIIMSKNDNLCSHMLEIFNKDLKKYGQNGDYFQREHNEFQSIPWMPIGGQKKIEFEEPTYKYALVDLNNDGIEDYVVKYGGCCFQGRYTSNLYMLDKKTQNLPYEGVLKESWNASNQVSFVPGHLYKLKIKETYISPEIVEVFNYRGIHYIAMHESLEISRPNHGYVVIAKYTGGKITLDSQIGMKDICYFRRIQTKK